MTCIVALRLQDGVALAGDKMGSNSQTGRIVKEPKVFVNKDFLVGYAGSFRMGQILRHIWCPPPRSIGQATDNYLYSDVVSSLIEEFKANNYGDEHANEWGCFVIVYEGRILEVQSDMSLLESDSDIVAIGSGEHYAMGAVQALLEYEDDLTTILDTTFRIVADSVVSVSPQYDYVLMELETPDQD